MKVKRNRIYYWKCSRHAILHCGKKSHFRMEFISMLLSGSILTTSFCLRLRLRWEFLMKFIKILSMSCSVMHEKSVWSAKIDKVSYNLYFNRFFIPLLVQGDWSLINILSNLFINCVFCVRNRCIFFFNYFSLRPSSLFSARPTKQLLYTNYLGH